MDLTMATAVSGLQASARSFAQSAFRVVNADSSDVADPPVDTTREFLNMKQDSVAYAANAKVITAASRMTGTLLDILA
jgi:hypothetical protein